MFPLSYIMSSFDWKLHSEPQFHEKTFQPIFTTKNRQLSRKTKFWQINKTKTKPNFETLRAEEETFQIQLDAKTGASKNSAGSTMLTELN